MHFRTASASSAASAEEAKYCNYRLNTCLIKISPFTKIRKSQLLLFRHIRFTNFHIQEREKKILWIILLRKLELLCFYKIYFILYYVMLYKNHQRVSPLYNCSCKIEKHSSSNLNGFFLLFLIFDFEQLELLYSWTID